MAKKNNNEKDPVAPTIQKMEVFEKVSFPASRFRVVKNACTDVKIESNYVKQFSTKMDNKAKLIHVFRTK